MNRLRRLKNPSNAQSIIRFLEATEVLRAKINNAKYLYFRFQLQGLLKTNPRKFWKSVSPTNTSSTSFVSGGQLISNPEVVANAFNTYFNSIFTDGDGVIPTFSSSPCYPPVADVSLSEEGILNLILHLDSKKVRDPTISRVPFLSATHFGHPVISVSFFGNHCPLALSLEHGNIQRHFLSLKWVINNFFRTIGPSL